MADFTVLTNLEVTGELKASGGMGLTKASYTVTSDDAAAAASTAPTKTEFDKLVTLANEIKADYNKLVAKLADGTDPS